MKLKNKSKKRQIQRLLIFSLILIFSAVILLFIGKKVYFSKDSRLPVTESEVKTTSSAPTAQENFTQGTDRDPGNSIGENEGSGSINDKSGQIDITSDENAWIKSTTGEITSYSPSINSVINNRSEVSGESVLPKVSFRIIDNVSGVIGQGELTVVNGKFSGTLNFTTTANEGRVDIYAVEEDGREYSNIEIPIMFKE